MEKVTSENQQISTMIVAENAEKQIALVVGKQQARTRVAKKLFLNHFQKALGTVSIATQLTGIERTTVYLWRRTDLEFKKEMDGLSDNMLDVAEDFLKMAALRNYMPSVHFWLSRRHPDYKINKCNHVTTIKNPYENLTEEQKFEKLKILMARHGSEVGNT